MQIDTPLKNRLLHLLAARPYGASAQDLAEELLSLRQVPPALAATLLRSVVGPDPCFDIRPESVRLADGRALDLFRQEFAVVDVETTGLALAQCRLTEVAVVVVRGNGDWIDEHSTLIDPGIPIPRSVTRLTGITDDMVAGAPPARAALPEALKRLEGRTVVAHNATFDRRFIDLERSRAGLPPVPELRWLCTRRLARRLRPGLASYGLDTLQHCFDIPNPLRHRALGDARATARVLLALLPTAVSAGCRTPDDLVTLSRRRLRARRKFA